MADKLSKVEISFDGGTTWTDVSDYCRGWKYQGRLNNEADLLNIKFVFDIKDTYTLMGWLPIRVYEGWLTSTDRLVFKGVITRIVDKYDYLVVDAADEIYKLLKSKRIAVYNKDTDPTAGVISAIAEDLIDEAGLTGEVEASGALLTIDQFITSDKTNVLERVSALASSLNWILLYDPEDDNTYFVSRGYFTNANVLTLPIDTATRPKWDEDVTRLFNDLTFKGGVVSSEDEPELFTGDGVENTFTLAKTPTDTVLVEVDAGAGFVKQVPGTVGVTSAFDYSINKANKQIIFEAASIPPAGADNTRVTYSSQSPPIVHLTNPTSINLYYTMVDGAGEKTGIKETIIQDDVTSNDDAEVRAQELLNTYSEPFYSTTVTLKASVDKARDYKLGDMIPVTDSNIGFTERNFIINDIERTWPGAGAKLSLGDSAYRLGQIENDLQSRISKLENQLSGDYNLLADYATFDHSIKFIRDTLVVSQNLVCDSFILGHPEDNGKIGYGIKLDDFTTNFLVNWTGSGFNLSEEAVIVLVGAKSGQLDYVAAGTHSITSTQTFGDVSTYTGTNSGTPSKGTAGVWINNDTSTITEVKLKLGSGASDYAYYTATIYGADLGADWQDDWTYLLFDLDDPDAVEGTPDWTACDYAVIEITLSSVAGTIYIDYFTISQSNLIALNGLGSRSMQLSTETLTL